MDNVNFTTQSASIYIKMLGDTEPYQWAGRKAQLGAITTPYGAVTATTAFNPRGGLYKDGVLVAEPGEVTTELTIKHVQHSRMRSALLNRSFNLDKRTHMSGKDKDSPTRWEDIERIVNARITDRTTAATTSAGEEEALITLPVSGQSNVDIYRTSYASAFIEGLDARIVNMSVGEQISHSSKGVVYAVTEPNVAHPDVNLLVNKNGGAFADWEVKVLTGAIEQPQGMISYGNTVIILFETYILRSDTYGEAFSQVAPDDWVEMHSIFGLDQTAIFAVGITGFISRSTDGGRTWKDSLLPNTITIDTLNGGYVVDERVVYSYGENGVLLRTNNFGESWYVVTTDITDSLLGLTAPSRNEFFFVTNTGDLYRSFDGGETIVIQGRLEGLPETTYGDVSIVQNRSDVFFLLLSDNVDTYLYRNVEGGASGYWYVPSGASALVGVNLMKGVMLDTNTFSIVGGNLDESIIASIR